MCISCNPMCGHCHPPKLRAVFCPDCGEYNLFKIIVCDPPLERLCKKCGRDLTQLATPKTVRCKSTGMLCANPCHRSAVEPNGKARHICRENSPPPRE